MEPVTVEDVGINFTLEERALLNTFQKKLCRDTMPETFVNLASIQKKRKILMITTKLSGEI
uniref:KRAB domain-containing protein n=1 Tax=Castor canadensis TaxID=51338 RepID=A0A8C0ZLX2_CASCN